MGADDVGADSDLIVPDFASRRPRAFGLGDCRHGLDLRAHPVIVCAWAVGRVVLWLQRGPRVGVLVEGRGPDSTAHRGQ